MTMRLSYQIAGTLLLLFAVFIAYESLQLRYYTPKGPGPGFFPFWLSLILGGLALGMLLQATFGRAEPMPVDFFATRSGYLKMGAVISALALTTVLLERLGFCLTTFAMYLFLLYALGRQSLIVTALVTLTGSFGVYYAFVHWLQVPLPKGLLGL